MSGGEGSLATESAMTISSDAPKLAPRRAPRRTARSPRNIAIVLTILLTILGLAHRYFIVRLVHDPMLSGELRTLATTLIAALGLSIVAHPILDRRFGPGVGRVSAWPAYIWLATCFYLLLTLGLSDLALAVLGLEGIEVERQRALGVVVSVTLVLLFGLYSGLRVPSVKRVSVAIPGWPAALDGYRLVQLSDVHIGTLIDQRFAERVTARVNELDADAVAITGDLVDGSVERIGERVAPFGALRGRDGVFFITGNHDYYSGAADWCARLTELGMRVLRNEGVAIERHGARFWLAGVDDYSSRRRSEKDIDDALRGTDASTPVVLLAHDPRTFEQAHRRHVSLQLSGHTHGGQMWPFTWLVRLQSRFVAGLYRVGSAQLYVSRGTGYWGPPVRVFAPAEITLLELRAAAAG